MGVNNRTLMYSDSEPLPGHDGAMMTREGHKFNQHQGLAAAKGGQGG